MTRGRQVIVALYTVSVRIAGTGFPLSQTNQWKFRQSYQSAIPRTPEHDRGDKIG